MMDQSAANTNSIAAVCGEEGQGKTKTCQWYYLHNVAHHSKQLPAENRKPFMKLAQDLFKVFTVYLHQRNLKKWSNCVAIMTK